MSFLLVGDGEPAYRTRLEQLADELRDRVYFLGRRPDVPDILAASDVFALPSEGGLSSAILIEAAASGLPLVATKGSGAADILEDSITGSVIRPRRPDLLAEKIRWLIDHPETARQMGAEANRRARARFSLPAQAAALTLLYQAVAEKR